MAETLTFQNRKGTALVTLAGNEALKTALAAINSKTSSLGIYAVVTPLERVSRCRVTLISPLRRTRFRHVYRDWRPGDYGPTTSSTATGNALAAVAAITAAVNQLGQVQARVGAGENVLNYAINLANSQITNYSATESSIKDADVATAAANLTKAQVLQQASVAAWHRPIRLRRLS